MRVRKAVFPAAGWGTRFLPATKAQPKELLPLVDKPVIQYAVRAISDLAQISYVRQKEQLGLGHAVLVAKELIGHEPFAVILSDDVVVGERPCIGQLIEAYQRTHCSVVAVTEVPHEDTCRYGIIAGEPAGPDEDPRLYKVSGLVEKPDPAQAPSDLAIIGRYILTTKIFDKLEQTQRWRDPAHRRHPSSDEGTGRLRVRFRRRALRCRHHDGLAQSVGRAGAPETGHRGRVPEVLANARLELTDRAKSAASRTRGKSHPASAHPRRPEEDHSWPRSDA